MSLLKTYQALQFGTCGDPAKVLSLSAAMTRHLQDGEVMVRMLSSPINPADINFIQGVYGRTPVFHATPHGPFSFCGMEGCGVVEESRDPALKPGVRVIALRAIGTWGEYLVARGSELLAIDSAIVSHQAAMLKVNPMTAWRLLSDFVDLKPGDWIALNAANSGVGRCVIQIAHILDLHTVSFVRKQAQRIDELRSLGADLVFEDGSGDAYRNAIDALGTARPMLAINAVGGTSASNLLQLLDSGGCMVTYGGMSLRNVQVSTSQLIFKDIRLRGFWLSEWMKRADEALIRADYARLGNWMAQGRLVQAVDCTFPLGGFQQALGRAREEFRCGRVLFDVKA